MSLFLKRHKHLEDQIDLFLNLISEAAIIFLKGTKEYLNGNDQDFNDHLTELVMREHKADDLKNKIESELYQKTLIPENRGDVLGLLENLDDVIDQTKETLNQFSVENPLIDKEYHEQFIKLAETSGECVEQIILAVRAFFTNFNLVPAYLHKVHFYESHSDKLAENLKRIVFASDLDLAHKQHLRYFALHIENIADIAESVADRLAVYTIKRQI